MQLKEGLLKALEWLSKQDGFTNFKHTLRDQHKFSQSTCEGRSNYRAGGAEVVKGFVSMKVPVFLCYYTQEFYAERLRVAIDLIRDGCRVLLEANGPIIPSLSTWFSTRNT